jgi:hypothetical protein
MSRGRRAQVRPEAAGVVAGDRDEGADRLQRDLGVRRCAGGSRGGHPLGDDLAEARIGRVLPDAETLGERQGAERQVLRTPAEHGRVEGDDQRRGATGLGAPDEAVDQRLVGAPVELHPVRGAAHLGGALLHRSAALVGEDVRDARAGGRAGRVQVGVRVYQLPGADGCQEQRRREAGAEQVHRQVTGRSAVRHARHDRPAVERGAVVAHRASLAGASGDVSPALRRGDPLRDPLERGERRRHGRRRSQHAVAVDRALPLTARSGCCVRGRRLLGHVVPFARSIRTVVVRAYDDGRA